jgi:hypothetical protein
MQKMKNLVPGWLSSKVARYCITAAAFVFSFAILGYMVYREKELLFSYNWHVHWEYLLIAFILYTLNFILVNYVWMDIVRTFGIHVSFIKHLQNYSIANLMKRLPGTVWYVAWRAQTYKEDGISPKVTSIASGIELGILAVSCLLVSLSLTFSLFLKYQISAVSIVAVCLLIVVFLNPRTLKWLLKKIVKVDYEVNYQDILKWILIYVVTRFVGGGILFCISSFINVLDPQYLFFVIGVQSLIGVLSLILLFSPTNLGLSEVGISFLLSTIMPSFLAVITAVASRVVVILFEIVWALIALIMRRGEDKPINPNGLLLFYRDRIKSKKV